MHEAREHQQPLYVCCVDFKKTFDSISHDKLWVTMTDMAFTLHLIVLLSKLYRKQCSCYFDLSKLSEWFCVKKGVQQGCPFSVLVQHPSGDGDEGDPRWISRWTTNWTANSHEPLLRLRLLHHPFGHFVGKTTGSRRHQRTGQINIVWSSMTGLWAQGHALHSAVVRFLSPDQSSGTRFLTN